MNNLFNFVHGFILGGFSIYGAVLFSRWILRRRWHPVVMFVALVFDASLVASGFSLMVGGPLDDLRIFTELLASAGSSLRPRA